MSQENINDLKRFLNVYSSANIAYKFGLESRKVLIMELDNKSIPRHDLQTLVTRCIKGKFFLEQYFHQ